MSSKLHDRQQAGELLAERLQSLAGRPDVIVLGLARGGLAVACPLAARLGLPVDVFMVRKLGVPGYEELAMGAVATGGVEILDSAVAEEFDVTRGKIDEVAALEKQELQRSERLFRGNRPPIDFRDRTAILVDDGIATGATMRAAIEGVKKLGAAHVIVAAPVAPLATCLLLRPEVDDVVCLATPREFRAVGPFYDEFPQLTDGDVSKLLNEARSTIVA